MKWSQTLEWGQRTADGIQSQCNLSGSLQSQPSGIARGGVVQESAHLARGNGTPSRKCQSSHTLTRVESPSQPETAAFHYLCRVRDAIH